MKDFVILTGATGFLGQYLLRDLLNQGFRVCAIARANDQEHAESRIEQILLDWERHLNSSIPRPVCFAGDVCEENLGLKSRDLDWVSEHARSVIHNAAIVSFDDSMQGRPMQTNLLGAKNVNGFCETTGIRDLHHVSTAYVCGIRNGIIYESDLDCGQSFRNEYEQSKFAAEKLFRESESLDSLTIYRPSVIAGDSRTGFTQTFHGIFHYLKLISLIVRNTQPDENGARYTPIRLDMRGDEPRNVVPVDWVSKVICHLYGMPESHGHTFHLTPDIPLTPRDIIEAGYAYFNSYGVEFCGAGANLKGSRSQMDQDWHANMEVYKNYEQSDPIFDTQQLKKFAAHLPCPPIDEPMLHRFWEYGENHQWGKLPPSVVSST